MSGTPEFVVGRGKKLRRGRDHELELSSPALEVVCAVLGLLAGALVVFAAPRLVAYRLDKPGPAAPVAVLVPVVGALMARWRLVQSLGTEVALAAIFAGLAMRFGARRELLIGAIDCTILAAIAYIDIDHRLVLNRLSYPGTVIGFVGASFWPGIGPVSALIGAAVGLVLFGIFQVIGRGALGTGDTKLALCIGAMRGFPTVFNALVIGVVLGGLAAAFLWFVLRRGRKSFFAYAPYLSAGAILSFFLPSG